MGWCQGHGCRLLCISPPPHCLLKEVFQEGALCAKAPEARLGGWCRESGWQLPLSTKLSL